MSHITALAIWGLLAAGEPIHITIPSSTRSSPRGSSCIGTTGLRSTQPTFATVTGCRSRGSNSPSWTVGRCSPSVNAATRSSAPSPTGAPPPPDCAKPWTGARDCVTRPPSPTSSTCSASGATARSRCGATITSSRAGHAAVPPPGAAQARRPHLLPRRIRRGRDGQLRARRYWCAHDAARPGARPRRDAALAALGILVVRFSHRLVHDAAAVRLEVLSPFSRRERTSRQVSLESLLSRA